MKLPSLIVILNRLHGILFLRFFSFIKSNLHKIYSLRLEEMVCVCKEFWVSWRSINRLLQNCLQLHAPLYIYMPYDAALQFISSRVEDCFSPSLIWLGLVFCFAYYWVGQSSIRFFHKVFWENPNTVSGQLNRMRWKGVSSEPNFFLFWRLFAAWRIIRITYWRLSQHMQQIKSILANAFWPHQPSS